VEIMNNENKTNINWFPGHMAKAKREIKEKRRNKRARRKTSSKRK